jgi:hypothetical protein
MQACELLTIETRLDQIEAELTAELPPHMRAFARAHTRRLPVPPAPDVLRRPATLATARAALVHPVLADRGLALLRLAAPVAIEADPAVAAARLAAPTWAGLSALAAARDAAAIARFGRRAIDVLHRLHGSAVDLADLLADDRPPGAAPGQAASSHAGAARLVAGDTGEGRDPIEPPALAGRQRTAFDIGADGNAGPASAGGGAGGLPPAVPGWFEPDGVTVDERAIAQAWDQLRARHGVDGALRYERAAGARPRAFVVAPGREVVLAIPAQVATPAERFAVLHELGHAVAALALPAGLPRVVDEAAAAYVARAIERGDTPWHSPAAGAARARRRRLAQLLDGIERALPAPPPFPPVSERPPWALWHDSGAQAAYVAAEWLADAIEQAIGASPALGALAATLTAWSASIDRLGSTAYAI